MSKIEKIKNLGIDVEYLEMGKGKPVGPSDTIFFQYRAYYEDNKDYALSSSIKYGKNKIMVIDNLSEPVDENIMVGLLIVLSSLNEGDAVRSIIPPKYQNNSNNKQTNLKLNYKQNVILDLLIIKVIKNS